MYLPPFPRSTRVFAHLRGRYPFSYVHIVIYEVSFGSDNSHPLPSIFAHPKPDGYTAKSVQSFLGASEDRDPKIIKLRSRSETISIH